MSSSSSDPSTAKAPALHTYPSNPADVSVSGSAEIGLPVHSKHPRPALASGTNGGHVSVGHHAVVSVGAVNVEENEGSVGHPNSLRVGAEELATRSARL